MMQPRSIDHITLCVENLEEAEFLFTKVLGFEVIWSARDVGTDKSSMDTVVVQCGADALAVITEWHEFREPDFPKMRKLLREPVVFDGRNIYEKAQMKAHGFTYYSIGR